MDDPKIVFFGNPDYTKPGIAPQNSANVERLPSMSLSQTTDSQLCRQSFHTAVPFRIAYSSDFPSEGRQSSGMAWDDSI
jgi:hypothetical protein